MKSNKVRVAVVYNLPSETTFSYHKLWPKAFAEHPELETFPINLSDHRYNVRARAYYLKAVWRPDVIVCLHSTYANDLVIPDWLVLLLADMDAKKIFFLTNVYKNMPEKMQFCERIGVDVLAQLGSNEFIASAYQKRLPAVKVVSSHAGGLDETLFYPGPPLDERPIDIGFRGEVEPYYFGHQERSWIMQAVQEAGEQRGLKLDMSMESKDRFDPNGWAGFLRNCRAQLGTEGGTDFFNLDDKVRYRVNAYREDNPSATFEEVFRDTMEPFKEKEWLRCRLITGRVIEAAASQSVLMLYEGHYEGYLTPDIHYIPIALDHRNLSEAFDKLSDSDFCLGLTEASYTLVREKFTFKNLIDEVLGELE
ncbi:hypothetical protein [Aestuariispira insulae]|uniref:Glycosyl transferase family 1 n=1 Tax=Aestuariispira insulae TaxID=1461337 RepID=A0A3D9H485_9PROT|nr:hypothetical protein [Aestuariispira insulae]RED44305.1 hypothetical protein DFP90_11558 [Aestuariispira insulae]